MLIKKGWLGQGDVEEKSPDFYDIRPWIVTIYIYIKIVSIS